MGKITAYNQNNFKSAEFLYSKIKRELKGFSTADLIDTIDFPQYTADVLRLFGNISLKEADAFCNIVNGKCMLPTDFKQLYAAYTCNNTGSTCTPNRNLQYTNVVEQDVTCELLQRGTGCEFDCCGDKLINRVTVTQYVNDNIINTEFGNFCLMQLSPNVRELCADECLNIYCSNFNEITITNGVIYTNFPEGTIYMQYYAFPMDEKGLPMIPDSIEIETAIEWYIKWKLMLNFWFNDDIPNAQSKWQKAEEMYRMAFAEAKFMGKLPAFSTLVHQIQTSRKINKLAAFSQNKRYNY